MAKKFCPLLKMDANTAPFDAYCKEEKCAWWEGGPHQCCAILIISISSRLPVRIEGPVQTRSEY